MSVSAALSQKLLFYDDFPIGWEPDMRLLHATWASSPILPAGTAATLVAGEPQPTNCKHATDFYSLSPKKTTTH